MTSRVSLSILALLCSLPSLCPAALFAADSDVPGVATASPDGGAGSASGLNSLCPNVDSHARRAPAITGLRIVALTGPSDCILPTEKVPASAKTRAKTRAKTKSQALPAQDQKPACAGVAVSPTGLAHFELAIAGTHLLSGNYREPTVQLETADAGRPIVMDPRFRFKSDNEIDVSGDAPLGTVINVVKVGSACNDSFTVTFTPKASGLQKFLVKLDHQANAQFPNLHSLVLTKQSGDGGFAARPSLMSVDLQPTGPTDLAIVQTSEAQLDLHFVAAQDYVPANAVVTVYDSSDLDARKPIAIAALAPAADPNAPTISSVETVFLDRGNGNGRIRIHGKDSASRLRPPSRWTTICAIASSVRRSTATGPAGSSTMCGGCRRTRALPSARRHRPTRRPAPGWSRLSRRAVPIKRSSRTAAGRTGSWTG